MDVSARCFLEVQLNLEYRRQWDSSVVALESSHSTKEVGDSAETEIIRWVSRFPFPMARREYVYARRWWLTTSIPTSTSNESSIALIVSRACNYKPKLSDNDNCMDSGSHRNGVGAQSEGGLVTVRAYESNMLIRSHGNIDEPGMDYFLVYSDDPQLILSADATNRISSSGKIIFSLAHLFYFTSSAEQAQRVLRVLEQYVQQGLDGQSGLGKHLFSCFSVRPRA